MCGGILFKAEFLWKQFLDFRGRKSLVMNACHNGRIYGTGDIWMEKTFKMIGKVGKKDTS